MSDERTGDIDAESALRSEYLTLGGKCFDAFTKALQSKGLTLRYETKQAATP